MDGMSREMEMASRSLAALGEAAAGIREAQRKQKRLRQVASGNGSAVEADAAVHGEEEGASIDSTLTPFTLSIPTSHLPSQSHRNLQSHCSPTRRRTRSQRRRKMTQSPGAMIRKGKTSREAVSSSHAQSQVQFQLQSQPQGSRDPSESQSRAQSQAQFQLNSQSQGSKDSSKSQSQAQFQLQSQLLGCEDPLDSQSQVQSHSQGSEDPSDDSSQPQPQRRTRGPTRCLSLWNRPVGERIAVTTNRLGQVVGPKASKLSNFLGTIARNGKLAPLNYCDWRGMPDASKDNMWMIVQGMFEIDPNCKSWVLKSLGKKWKDWKCELKGKYYNPYETIEERLVVRDSRVDPHQWRALVEFWDSKEGQSLSAKNKVNRGKQKIGHTAGTKSFARIRDEESAKRSDGAEISRAEMFILTHIRKDGNPVDEASSAVLVQLHERTSQLLEGSHSSTARDEIFSQVMGEDRHGRVRTYGLGPSPSDLWGKLPSRVDAAKMLTEAKKEASERERVLQEKMDAMASKFEQMEAQMASKYAHMEEKMNKVMSVVQRRLPNDHLPEVSPLGPDDRIATEASPRVFSLTSSRMVSSPEGDFTPTGRGSRHLSDRRVQTDRLAKKGKKRHVATSGVI